MKKLLMQLLSDQGHMSMTRFLSLICVLAALLISGICLYMGQSPDTVVGLVSVFLGSAFGGKVLQSFAERDNKPTEDKETE